MNQSTDTTTAQARNDDAVGCYLTVRAATEALARPLSAEDCCVQSMPDASPAKWHLAHTSWFFETFILERCESDFVAFDAAFRVLFNSYYQGVGRQHPRPQRGLLTRPSLATVLAYRADVDARMLRLLQQDGLPEPIWTLLELGLQHEQQHQELLLTDIKHLLWCNPLWPAYRDAPAVADSEAAAPSDWQPFEGGLVQTGHAGAGFAFDNELPRHSVFLQPYALATRPVMNAEYLAFMADGGYANPAHWLAEGWDWCRSQQITHPLYWREEEGAWSEFTLWGGQPLAPHQPVVHLSYYEADAYARWAGARLPSEAEWEIVAAHHDRARDGAFSDDQAFHPRPAASGPGLAQMLGDVWEWTASAYAPYPGFRPLEGAFGEYNGKFMVSQLVLRGGSCVTPRDHVRVTYRNFFPPGAQWQFSGIRLARDA